MSQPGEFSSLYYDPAVHTTSQPPFYDGTKTVLIGSNGLTSWSGPTATIYSPILKRDGSQVEIGLSPQMGEKEALEAVNAAAAAFNSGLGFWPTCGVQHRINVVQQFAAGLAAKRDEIVNLLMWEICKNLDDARKEVDRTVAYIYDTIAELKKIENKSSTYEVVQGVVGHIRRAPLGVVLCLGPFNYPLNETYTTFIPALIMGNTVVMKLPKTGALAHLPTLPLFQQLFPPGVINIISGAGRVTMPPIMKSGLVDCFAFIGTNTAAAAMIKDHPSPNRLRICLGLDAKNPAFVLPSANLDLAVSEILLGSLSYNGQRCTAIKIVFVHESIIDQFLPKLIAGVDALKMGLPWESGVKITPLPEKEKPAYLKAIIADAEQHGAKIVNPRGGKFDRSFVAPTILYPVTAPMKVWHEEQFGPIVPVAVFKEASEMHSYLRDSSFGQQAAVFSTDHTEIGSLIDVLVNVVSRVNINSQCQRGPDQFPFTGRKNSGAATLSIHDALRVFSIRSIVACKETTENTQLLNAITRQAESKFLRLDHLF